MCRPNGTRLILRKVLNNRLLRVDLSDSGKSAFIPHITLMPTNGESGSIWKRREFPERAAYTVSINKFQVQASSKIEVWLEEDVFMHGQLYVAASLISEGLMLVVKYKKN